MVVEDSLYSHELLYLKWENIHPLHSGRSSSGQYKNKILTAFGQLRHPIASFHCGLFLSDPFREGNFRDSNPGEGTATSSVCASSTSLSPDRMLFPPKDSCTTADWVSFVCPVSAPGVLPSLFSSFFFAGS
mmetsp:Transcript_10601/g.24590  ORF Transcript_10601/g.24590 Transcript_10601/m.24590 type:complete len:131 (+) Transcript_10601:1158-1550(+)